MNKKIIIVLIILLVAGLGYFYLNSNQQPKSLQNGWETYTNKELGISFNYPPNFKVYNSSKDELRVESDYKKEGALGASIGMNITRINAQRETDDQINYRLQGKKIIKDENRNSYRILKFEGGSQYYILSDKGTFYIGDSLDIYKDSLSQEQFTDYRAKFDGILSSIVVR